MKPLLMCLWNHSNSRVLNQSKYNYAEIEHLTLTVLVTTIDALGHFETG